MNGMSLAISKPCCPVYNCGTSNKINLIPRRLSNLHLQGIFPPVSTTRMLKHRAYSLSAFKDVKDASSEVPEVSAVYKGPYVLPGIGVINVVGIALAKNWEAVAQSISTIGGIRGILKLIVHFYIPLVVLASLVAGPFLADVMNGLAVVLLDKPFSIGDTIEVGSLEGQVIKIGFITTSLLSAEKVPMRVPNSFFCRKAIFNKSRVGWVAMVSKIFVQVDEIEKIQKISEEIVNIMKSNSNIYLEKEQPYCCLSGFQRHGVELTLGCNLKPLSEHELCLVKQDVLEQSVRMVEKNGATLIECMGK